MSSPRGAYSVLKCECGEQDEYIFRSVSTTRCADGAEETQQAFVREAEPLDTACFCLLWGNEFTTGKNPQV